MKSNYLLLIVLMFFTYSFLAQVGVGTVTPDAALDVVSTTDCLLIPRVALSAQPILQQLSHQSNRNWYTIPLTQHPAVMP